MNESCAHAPTPGKPFALPGATEHYTPDRPVRAEHVRIEVDLDFERQRIAGVCTTHLVAVRETAYAEFDAISFDVDTVEVEGKAARFDNTGEKVRVHFAHPLAVEAKAHVVIRYRVRPQRGLYFWSPDEGYPNRPLQAWTQGQDEDSRAWFPCLDAPSQRSSTEVLATFPKEMTALSNGVLLADEVRGGRRTMHYQFNFPHPPYLVTLAVGEFEEAQASAGDTQLRYLFPKGRKEDALRCVQRTPQMMALFEEITGQKYPYVSYAQVFVAEFIFGGMENTSATTLTDAALHDARAHLDYSAESLIAHELMHQWFGDLLTCREWPQGWLNEGFATYGEVLWKERSEGADEADHYRRGELDNYLREARESYARPIVARKFHQPVELFDRHLYEKGGLVLHELRRRLGDGLFFKGLKHYVEKNVGRSVETVDLARALEDSSGHSLDRFFDQYVFAAGHPDLKVEVKHDAEHARVDLRVKQANAKDAQGIVYWLPLEVRLVVAGKETAHQLELTDSEQVFRLAAAAAPTQVRVDPRREALGTLDVDKPAAMWLEELAHAPEARARTEAAVALGKDGSHRAVEALGKALQKDRFWGTQAACASALAAIRTPDAKQALLDAVGVEHPKARRAVVAALGFFRQDEHVGKALRRICEKGDPSYFVEAEAAHALGKLKLPDTLPVLAKVAQRPSFQDVVAAGAIDGMAETLLPEAYALVEPLVAYGRPPFIRRAAAVALGRLAEPAQKKREAIDTLADLLRDKQFRVQMAAFEGALALGDRRLIPALESTPFLDGRCVRAAKDTARALREGEPQAKEVAALRDELDKLKTETKRLKERVEAITPSRTKGKSGRAPGRRRSR
jgi:aminopeptidase N